MAGQSWIRGKLLGVGSFGSVNLAIDREDGEVFAVKSVQLNERDAGSEVALRAIENEIEILQKLDSRFVVKYLGNDWTDEGGQLMRNIFLEYMPEGCLTDFVKQFGSSLDEHLLRTYTRSIVEGIDYLHSQGIVHCDIKGKNILVGNGSVKLTDFGSAKRVDMEVEVAENDLVNCSAKVNGTPLWMAPEVVRQVEQGPASDIWSLGCTVVELASGRAPWGNLGGNHFAALYHIGCTDELPSVPTSLSAVAHDFLSHCFQRDPRRRWTSAQLLKHPFLTTRFVPAPVAVKAPSSPISVTQFPDSDDSASFVNSVPTLAAAPSLIKRGLVSAQSPVEENWWSTPAGIPDSGPWIVVRSPKSSSSPPSFALSNWRTPVSAITPSAEASIEAHEDEDLGTAFDVLQTLSSPVLHISSSVESEAAASSDADEYPHIQIIANGENFCQSALSDADSSVVGTLDSKGANSPVSLLDLENFEVSSTKHAVLIPGNSLNLGLAALIGTINEYSERVFQYSNAQILLYWYIRKVWLRSNRDIGIWRPVHNLDHCILQLLVQYTIPASFTPNRITRVDSFHLSTSVEYDVVW